jgi:hypothetical protein
MKSRLTQGNHTWTLCCSVPGIPPVTVDLSTKLSKGDLQVLRQEQGLVRRIVPMLEHPDDITVSSVTMGEKIFILEK